MLNGAGPTTVATAQSKVGETWVPGATPENVVRYQANSNVFSLNQGYTFFADVPGEGHGVAKCQANPWANTHAEWMACEFDKVVPAMPGGAERIVPDTSLILVPHEVPTSNKDGSAGQPMPAGMYSFQKFLTGCHEYSEQPRPAGQGIIRIMCG